MPVKAVQRIAQGQNGLSAFVLPLRRLDFHYSDWAGSSKGMNSFLKHILPRFARSNPGVEIHVSPRPHSHPVIRGHYINGKEKAVCVRNLEMEQVLLKAELLRDASGEVNKRVRQKVKSTNGSVRGIWSPFHAGEGSAWKI